MTLIPAELPNSGGGDDRAQFSASPQKAGRIHVRLSIWKGSVGHREGNPKGYPYTNCTEASSSWTVNKRSSIVGCRYAAMTTSFPMTLRQWLATVGEHLTERNCLSGDTFPAHTNRQQRGGEMTSAALMSHQ